MLKKAFCGLISALCNVSICFSESNPNPSPSASVIEIRGTINPATSQYLKRAIAEAEQAKSAFLLVELDTPGGLVTSVREMVQSVDTSKVPVILYVTPAGASATSAGALLSFASHVAAMAPGTNIGAAHPVSIQGQGQDAKEKESKAMEEKAVNDVSAFARSIAKLRGRNADAASEVVSHSKSFTADEAVQAKLIDLIAIHREDLLNQLNKKKVKVGDSEFTLSTLPHPELQKIDMTKGEEFFNYMAHPNIAAILLTLGILLIYAELSAPGISIAGILGGLSLLMAFISFQAIPIRSGAMFLVLLGPLLLLAEFFVVSGGALAVGGLITFCLGLIWFADPSFTAARVDPWLLVLLIAILLLGAAFLSWAALRMRRLNRVAIESSGSDVLAGLRSYTGQVDSVHSDGTEGTLLIRGEYWKFHSASPVKKGDAVLVEGVKGLLLEIKKLEKESKNE